MKPFSPIVENVHVNTTTFCGDETTYLAIQLN